jgi:hypothetical protein
VLGDLLHHADGRVELLGLARLTLGGFSDAARNFRDVVRDVLRLLKGGARVFRQLCPLDYACGAGSMELTASLVSA